MIARMKLIDYTKQTGQLIQETGNSSGDHETDWADAILARESGDRLLLIAAIEEGRDIQTTNETPIHLSNNSIIYPIGWSKQQKLNYVNSLFENVG